MNSRILYQSQMNNPYFIYTLNSCKAKCFRSIFCKIVIQRIFWISFLNYFIDVLFIKVLIHFENIFSL